MEITVVNKHHKATGEYIGRGSPLGNPFSHMEGTKASYLCETREEAIDWHKMWIQERIHKQDPAIINELERLYALALTSPLNLVCFCSPKPCHGDTIREILLEAHATQTNP